jgi:hypothetical protein
MRITACFIWGAYSIEVQSLLMLMNNLITLSSTLFISYYKVKEIIYDYKKKQMIIYTELQNNELQNNESKDDNILTEKV